MKITDLPIVRFDDETRSGFPINDGRIKYVTSTQADIICMGWKMPGEATKLWLPGAPIPYPFRNPERYRFAAFNIQFDSYIQETLGAKYGFKPIPLENQVDIMAVAARFGLPQKLDRLGPALNVRLPKMSIGTSLKKLLCMPPFHDAKKLEKMGKQAYMKWHKEQVRLFYEYCIRDVDCMDEIMIKMPMSVLPPAEQHIWQVNCVMNRTGVPVDHPAVKRIDEVCDFYRAKEAKRVSKLTNGEIKTIGQTQKIQEWASERGVEMENLQAQTVKDTIADLDKKLLDPFEDEGVLNGYKSVRDLLVLRQKIGGAAVKKYKKLDAQTINGRIHDNSRYHGAGTGRTTGGGFQYLNLPRAKIKPQEGETYDEAVDKAIKSFYDTTVLQTPLPLEIAKALVRPMIRASKGKVLLVADWSSIEYILLMWFAGEWDKVRAFKDGSDPYITFATKLFNVDYQNVTGDQRQKAKPPVLGSGYMLGWRGLIEYAAGYGVTMTDEEAQFATNTYRQDNPLVVKAWYALKDASHDAVRCPGKLVHAVVKYPYKNLSTSFKVVQSGQFKWLIMTLPSGRSLFYCDPKIVDGQYGDMIKHRGINPKTKQWGWVYLKPQRTIENVIQGLGRDVLTHGMDRVLEAGFTPIGTIYDEIICEEPDRFNQAKLEEMVRLMCIMPPWGKRMEGLLPLKADGYYSYRYKKN
jgi:hypothetical protein